MVRKIRILNAEYREDYDVLIWKVQFLDDNSETRLMFRGKNLHEVLGVSSVIPPYLIKKFCVDMRDKEINLDMRAQAEAIDEKELKNMDVDKIQNMTKFWHEYPFHEAHMIENEENEK